jgi:REP element-mobilizing transposase RayT
MARLSRKDLPGAWHHVVNRGIARRPVFENRACVRHFLACLARVVRRGDLEVHSYVFQATHYHLLVRSPTGRLSESMRLVQNRFVRWFNRRNRRDGPLFRGRFLSRPVESLRYRRILVRYIDQNPVLAGVVDSPEDYPHGSARHYAFESGPRWLERSWVERDALERTGAGEFSRLVYRRAFGEAIDAHEVHLVEARLEHTSHEPDSLDDLVHATPASIGRWMQRKAALADGTRPGLPCIGAERVSAVCSRAAAAHPEWQIRCGANRIDVGEVLEVALLRDVAGLRWSEISRVVSAGESSGKRRYQIHRARMETMKEYRELVRAVATECLQG